MTIVTGERILPMDQFAMAFAIAYPDCHDDWAVVQWGACTGESPPRGGFETSKTELQYAGSRAFFWGRPPNAPRVPVFHGSSADCPPVDVTLPVGVEKVSTFNAYVKGKPELQQVLMANSPLWKTGQLSASGGMGAITVWNSVVAEHMLADGEYKGMSVGIRMLYFAARMHGAEEAVAAYKEMLQSESRQLRTAFSQDMRPTPTAPGMSDAALRNFYKGQCGDPDFWRKKGDDTTAEMKERQIAAKIKGARDGQSALLAKVADARKDIKAGVKWTEMTSIKL